MGDQPVREQDGTEPEPEARVDRAVALAEAARNAGVAVKFLGGMGCWLHVHDQGVDELLGYRRAYHDLDVIVRKDATKSVGHVLEGVGYEPVRNFNAVQGEARLMYIDTISMCQLDVFLGEFRMCHLVRMGDGALDVSDHPSLRLAELLLTKLQVVELTSKDLNDVGSLLACHDLGNGPEEIDAEQIGAYLASDWGLWRTVTFNLQRLREWTNEAPARGNHIRYRVDEILRAIDAAPRSRKWKLRSRVGERLIWYELPEEPETEWTEIR